MVKRRGIGKEEVDWVGEKGSGQKEGGRRKSENGERAKRKGEA